MNKLNKWIENLDMSACRDDFGSKQAAATQVGGDHYTRLAVQPWAAMESWMTPEQFRGFLIGNVIRYMARTKTDVKEDHRKAAHYLQKLIEVEAK